MNHVENPSKPVPMKPRSPYLLWAIWMIWVPFAVPAFIALFQSHPPLARLLISLFGGMLFLGIYLWATLQNARRLVALDEPAPRSFWRAWFAVLLLTTLSLLLTIGDGPVWGSLFIFTAAYSAGRLPVLQTVLELALLEILMLLGVLLGNVQWSDVASGMVLVAVVGTVVLGVARLLTTDRELRLAREEIARLAVTTERLRIARDLHDLLGHNLALITLKSELAGRLLHVAPERAASEISDIEQVARTTLEEVREAVTNYRQPTLANELHAASEILSAAGITYHYQNDEQSIETLPTPVEALLSWAVREAVTNVIRHSHAHQCTIRLTRSRQEVGIEVLDDGVGSPDQTSEGIPAAAGGHGGNGLRGLRERVTALGGKCEVGPRADGGFGVNVMVPLTPGKQEQ